MPFASNVIDLIGNTPLYALSRWGELFGGKASVYGKYEGANPFGSAKDRVALAMIEDAEARGLLRAGATIVEPTSGNTGIALAAIGRLRGYRVIIVMPDSMSAERKRLMRVYGAELVLTEGARGMTGSIARAREIAREIPDAWIPSQFENPANAVAHYKTTGPEIERDLAAEGRTADILVAGVGTGGTLTGTGRYLREKNPALRIVAVEPVGSPVLSGGAAGPHGLMGIGAGFVPAVLDRTLIDEVIAVDEEAAFTAARMLVDTEGLLVGISSGAALAAARMLAAREENRGKNIVVILPDGGERYLSTPLFE